MYNKTVIEQRVIFLTFRHLNLKFLIIVRNILLIVLSISPYLADLFADKSFYTNHYTFYSDSRFADLKFNVMTHISKVPSSLIGQPSIYAQYI